MSKNLLTPTGHMRRALRLAEKGDVLPNPMVGCIIVKNGERISEGFHSEFGGDHAEILAIKNAKESLVGATLYVTLEPCCHFGKTPPCVDAIIESGITKVLIASLDPSEKMNGKGIKILEEAGIKIETGLLKEEAEKLNEQFYTFHKKKRPFIALKVAMSLDGKIAKNRNERTFLTGKQAKKHSDILRKKHQAILIGKGSVLADNPMLGLSEIQGKEPLRIILGRENAIPKNYNIFRDENFLILENMSVNEVMEDLYKRGIISVLVEGGHEVFSNFINEKSVDRYYVYIAPKILGAEALDFAKSENDISLKIDSVQKLGGDIMISLSNNGV